MIEPFSPMIISKRAVNRWKFVNYCRLYTSDISGNDDKNQLIMMKVYTNYGHISEISKISGNIGNMLEITGNIGNISEITRNIDEITGYISQITGNLDDISRNIDDMSRNFKFPAVNSPLQI